MNPDHNIDRVLNALRDATPPANMERRILNLLEAEAHKPPRPIRPRLQNLWIAAAVCCAALVVTALIGTLTMRHHNAPAIARTTPAETSNASRSSTATIANTPTPHSHSATAPRSTIQPRLIQVAQSEAADQISHPAPPIPLTEQERILLRFARHGRTDDLAQISNDRKAAKEERDAAEFQAFFEPPPIKIGESE
ncbi:MAG TPA: hypothetical protein VK596_09240 [Edaphobacter sp.]|nr:hypothetical protein [Edaphobacter sp.]